MDTENVTSKTVITPARFALILLSPVILLALFIIWREVSSRSEVRVLRDERLTIQLIPSDHPKQLIYETEQVRIQVGYDDFEAYGERRMRGEFDGPAFLDEAESLDGTQQDPEQREAMIWPYREWIMSIEEKFEGQDEVILDIDEDDIFVANMLETGRASVFDKRTRREVQTIRMHARESICGMLCGGGYRYFYLPTRTLLSPFGILFLEVQDWFS